MKHITEGGIILPRKKFRTPFKISVEEMNTIIKTMSKDEKKVADTIYKYFNDIQKDKINKVSTDLNGFDIATEEDYFPIRTSSIDLKKDSLKQVKNMNETNRSFLSTTLEGMGIFKERKGASNPIILDDAFVASYKSMKEASAYVGLAGPLRNAKMLLNDSDFQRKLVNTHGPEYLNTLKDYVRDVEGTATNTQDVDRIISDVMNNITVSILGMNPWVMLKQPISYVLAGTEVDSKYLTNLTPEKKEVISKWSPQLRSRLDGNVSREMGEVSQVGEVKNFFTHKKNIQQNVVMKGISEFDYQSIGRIWKAVTKETNDLYPDLKGDERMEHIAQRTEAIVRKTQPTFDIKDRSQIGRSRNMWLRLLTKFSSQRNKNYMIAVRAIDRYNRSDKSFKAKSKLVKDIGAVSIISALLLAAVDRLRDAAYCRDSDNKSATTAQKLTNTAMKVMELNIGNIYGVGTLFSSFRSKSIVNAAVGLVTTGNQFMTQEEYTRKNKRWGIKKGELKWKRSIMRTVNDVFSVGSRIAGIPYDNIRKMVNIPKCIMSKFEGKSKIKY
jgi:hypothetical protein